jgi:hypothetical protein
MRAVLIIGLLTTTIGCGNPAPEGTSDQVKGSPSSGLSGTAADASREPSPTAMSANNQSVTVVGCLQGPTPRPLATSGTSAGAGTAGTAATSGTSAERFRLVDATAAAPETAGIGTQGAGASGGPLVGERSSFELDGISTDARAAVNKQVRITGRVDIAAAIPHPQPEISGNSTPGAPPPAGGSPMDRTVGSGERLLIVESVQVVSSTCLQPSPSSRNLNK